MIGVRTVRSELRQGNVYDTVDLNISKEVFDKISVKGGLEENVVYLVLGNNLTIEMTPQQEELIRFYYENT